MNGKAVAMWAGLLALIVAAIEVISFVVYSLVASQLFSYATVSEERRRVLAETAASEPAREMQADVWGWTFKQSILHPYLGYARNPRTANHQGAEHLTTIDTFVLTTVGGAAGQNSDDRTVIGITGGSVAEGFFLHVARTPEFRLELEKIPAFRGTEIQFVLLGLRGYKQPQQLLAVNYYLSLNEPLDVVINLDGWNEIGLSAELLERGINPIYPYHWSELTEDQITIEYLLSAGKVALLGNLRHRAAEMADRLPYHITSQLLWRLSDAFFKREIAQAQVEMSASDEDRPYFRVGPTFDGDLAVFYKWAASLWARASVDLHELSRSEGFEYFHFLQPSPCLGNKTLSESEERRFRELPPCPWCPYISAGYPALHQEGRLLDAQGEFYFDFTGVFQDIPGTSYADPCCHLTTGGNTVVASEMARIIKDRLISSRSASSRE